MQFFAPIKEIVIWTKVPSGIERQDLGISRSFEERYVKNKDHYFIQKVPPQGEVELVARLHSPFPITIYPSILNESAYVKLDHEMQLFVGIYIGFILSVAFIYFICFIWTTEWIYFSYTALMVFSHLLGVMSIYGLSSEFLFQSNPEIDQRLILPSSVSMTIVALWFTSMFLRPADKWVSWPLNCLLAFGICLALIVLIVTNPLLADLADSYSLISACFMLFAALVAAFRKSRSSLIFIPGFSCFLLGAVAFILQDHGEIATSPTSRYSLMAGSLLESIIFTIALGLRFYGVKVQAKRFKGDVAFIVDGQNQEQFEAFYRNKIESVEVNLAIMLIDVVGFSETVAKFSPRQLFYEHHEQVARVKSIIRKHGGIVGGTGGDSILAYFGYHPKPKSAVENFADNALDCAVEIQRTVCQGLSRRYSQGLPLFPLRIGIEVDTTFIGDLGDENHADITAIGEAINFARRLETACSPMKILIGSSMRERLKSSCSDVVISKKYLNVKHSEKLHEAFEVSIIGDDDYYRTLRRIVNEYFGKASLMPRLKVPPSMRLLVKTNTEDFFVVNFSETGFLLYSTTLYLANGVTFEICSFNLNDEIMPIDQKIVPFKVQVRWGEPQDHGYVHGISITSLNEINRFFLFNEISRNLGLVD